MVCLGKELRLFCRFILLCYFETAPKYGTSDSFVDHDGYSISSKGLMSTVVDIMII